MSIWFSSDWHLSHKKIKEFCPNTREGDSVEEMNELIIERHNKLVKPNDTFYHLGDFSFDSIDNTIKYLSRVNGKKEFLAGNHDKKMTSPQIRRLLESYRDYRTMWVGNDRFAMFHFPIESWDRKHYGTIHLHGHIHGNTSNGETSLMKNRMDVGLDNRPKGDMRPWHIDEVRAYLKEQNKLLETYGQSK